MIGILGGTFDPIHVGHVAMAQAVQKEFDLKKVLLIPDGDPPHKGKLADGKDRLEMARLAAEGVKGLTVSDIEIKRQGVTYTVDTLRDLRGWHPDKQYIYIVGSDTLLVIESWRSFPEVARLLAGIAVVPRPGDDPAETEAQARRIEAQYGVQVRLVRQCVSPVSSTQIRCRAARHQSLEGLVPPNVEKYIVSHKLYRDPMLEELVATMTPARFRHTLGVEETALELARIHGADPEKARLAALLHDCGKHMQVEDMVRVVREAHVETAPGEEDSRALLHAAAGMALARDKFGVKDPEILSAIRWHTTGKPNMSKLDQIIYLADMIEPGRRPFPGLEDIRQAARTDLTSAMRIAARRTVDYVKSRNMPLNERTTELLKSLESDDEKESTT